MATESTVNVEPLLPVERCSESEPTNPTRVRVGHENVSFFCPIFWGTQKRGLLLRKRAAALWEGTQGCKGGTGKAEAVKLLDAEISLTQCPEE